MTHAGSFRRIDGASLALCVAHDGVGDLRVAGIRGRPGVVARLRIRLRHAAGRAQHGKHHEGGRTSDPDHALPAATESWHQRTLLQQPP